MWTAFGGTRFLGERGGLARNRAADPLADGVARTAELARRRLDSMFSGMAHDLLVKPMTICAHTIQLKITAMHPRKMPSALDRSAFGCGGPGCPSLRSARGLRAIAHSQASSPDAAGPQTSLALRAAQAFAPDSRSESSEGGHDVPSSSHFKKFLRLPRRFA